MILIWFWYGFWSMGQPPETGSTRDKGPMSGVFMSKLNITQKERGYNLQEIFEGVQNPQKGTFTKPCMCLTYVFDMALPSGPGKFFSAASGPPNHTSRQFAS